MISLLLILGISSPASANPITDFIDSVQSGIDRAVGYYDGFVDQINNVFDNADITVQNVKGELGLPDLEQIERSIEEELAENGGIANSETLKTYVEIEAIQSHANSVLGAEGQNIDKQSIDASTEAVETVAALERQGNGRTVTQEVMKDLLKQQTQLAGLNSATNKSLIELKQSTAYNNRALAKQIKQNEYAKQKQLQDEISGINAELAVIDLLKKNLYASKPCARGEQTVFITQENGKPIPPRKTCV